MSYLVGQWHNSSSMKKKVQARCINMPKLTSRKGINFIATYLPQQSHMNSPYRVILATWKYSHYEILFCFQWIPSTHTHTHTNGSIKKNPWETGLHKQPVYPIFTIMWFDGINFLFFFGRCLGARFLVFLNMAPC
jgi:hypothetical protein